MFPCLIVSDANYDSITCNSDLLWPLPRCNEDPDCRNPRGFRIAIDKDVDVNSDTYIHTYIWALARAPDLHININQFVTSSNNSIQHTTKVLHLPDELSARALYKDTWNVTVPDSLSLSLSLSTLRPKNGKTWQKMSHMLDWFCRPPRGPGQDGLKKNVTPCMTRSKRLSSRCAVGSSFILQLHGPWAIPF